MTHRVQGSWWQTKMGLLWLNRSNRAQMPAQNGSTRNHSGNIRQLTECWTLWSLHHGHLGKWVCRPQPHQNGFLEACFFHDRLLIPSLTSMHLAAEPGSHAHTLAPSASGKVKASFYAGKVRTHEAGNPLHGRVPPKAKTTRKNDTLFLTPTDSQ